MVLRAFGREEHEVVECTRRLDLNQRACFVANAGTQWLALRLQGLGIMILGGMAGLAVVERCGFSQANERGSFGDLAGMAGLGLAYALPIVNALQGLIGAFAQTEKEMVRPTC